MLVAQGSDAAAMLHIYVSILVGCLSKLLINIHRLLLMPILMSICTVRLRHRSLLVYHLPGYGDDVIFNQFLADTFEICKAISA